MVKKGEKKYALEAEAGQMLLAHLNAGKPARTAPLNDEQRAAVHDWFLLTMKKVIYAANIGEEDLGKDENELPLVQPVRRNRRAERRAGAGDLCAGRRRTSPRWSRMRSRCSWRTWASDRSRSGSPGHAELSACWG